MADNKLTVEQIASVLGIPRDDVTPAMSAWTPDDIREYIRDYSKQVRKRLRAELAKGHIYELTDLDRLRFYSKVDRDGPYNEALGSSCWLWKAGTAAHGYGQFRLHGKQLGAHRAAWYIETGTHPGGAYVCHKCHNTGCVNIDHLYLGDHTTNMKDRRGRGYTFRQ